MPTRISHTQSKQQGFTLVEVIIVTAIIGIVSAIAIPAFLSWLPNIRLRGATRDLYSNMQMAKMEAIKSNTLVSLSFTPGVGIPCIGGTYTFSNSLGTIVSNSMSNDVCLTTPTNFPNGFAPNGLPSGAIGRIRLTHPKSSRTYVITQTIAGGVRVQ